jgi:hypothetical protein
METPIKSVLSILNRELKLATKLESQAILSQIIVEIKTNLIPFEKQKMAEMFDSGFSMGCDYALNDNFDNISGDEYLNIKNKSNKIITCEICDSEVIPNCKYEDCPYN